MSRRAGPRGPALCRALSDAYEHVGGLPGHGQVVAFLLCRGADAREPVIEPR